MRKALLADIDLRVRVVVDVNATQDEIVKAIVDKAIALATEWNQQANRSWFGENIGEIQDDEVVPYDPETENENGDHLMGYRIISITEPKVYRFWHTDVFTGNVAEEWLNADPFRRTLYTKAPYYDGDIPNPRYHNSYDEVCRLTQYEKERPVK